MSPNDFTEGHLLKIEWLVAVVPAVELPHRAERDILVMIFCFLGYSWIAGQLQVGTSLGCRHNLVEFQI